MKNINKKINDDLINKIIYFILNRDNYFITKEILSEYFNIKQSIAEQILTKLNLLGLVSQAHHNRDMDGNWSRDIYHIYKENYINKTLNNSNKTDFLNMIINDDECIAIILHSNELNVNLTYEEKLKLIRSFKFKNYTLDKLNEIIQYYDAFTNEQKNQFDNIMYNHKFWAIECFMSNNIKSDELRIFLFNHIIRQDYTLLINIILSNKLYLLNQNQLYITEKMLKDIINNDIDNISSTMILCIKNFLPYANQYKSYLESVLILQKLT